MTDEELREFEEQNWSRVPIGDRKRCVRHLRGLIFRPDGATREEWLEAMEEPGFHMFTGTAIRNSLRDVLKDEDLPEVWYPDGRAFHNWDDFYMAVLREVLA